MKSIRIIIIICVLVSIISISIYLSINNRTESIASIDSDNTSVTAHDRQLCERLIRFGQVAFEREQITEAKHFFQKAITVNPNNKEAWKRYNMALLAQISAKVESDPGFLPEFSSDSGVSDAPSQKFKNTSDDDDGC